mgnify:CR=1 FL=1
MSQWGARWQENLDAMERWQLSQSIQRALLKPPMEQSLRSSQWDRRWSLPWSQSILNVPANFQQEQASESLVSPYRHSQPWVGQSISAAQFHWELHAVLHWEKRQKYSVLEARETSGDGRRDCWYQDRSPIGDSISLAIYWSHRTTDRAIRLEYFRDSSRYIRFTY